MKKVFIILLIIISLEVSAQFKDTEIFKPSIKESVISQNPNLIFGFIDPAKFNMNHSYSMSYSSFAGNGIALGVYTNNMSYLFNEDLLLELDASLVHSPYSSFGNKHQDQLNGIYLSRAELTYKPWKNFQVSVQYRQVPNGFFFNPFSNYGYYNSLFESGWK